MSVEKIPVRDSDCVSGRQYRKLIEAYKAYDKQQKEYITTLQDRMKAYAKELAIANCGIDEVRIEGEVKYNELKKLVLTAGHIGELLEVV